MAEIDTVFLGRTGTQVSELALGTWRFGRETDAESIEINQEQAHKLLDAYADAGGNFIDTANIYGDGDSERWIGDWLADRDRNEFVIASKVFWPVREDDPNGYGLGRKHVREQTDAILDRLGTGYLDLLYIHRWDEKTPAEELMRTLDGLVDDGRVHYLGASTLRPNAWRVTQANEIANRQGYEPFTVSQPRYNLVDRETEGNYLEMCQEYDLGVMPWSPLAWGFLTGKYDREDAISADSKAVEDSRFQDIYLSEENFEVLDIVKIVADEVGASPTQVSIAWLLENPNVTAPLLGARTVEQLEENLGAASISLSDDQYQRLADAKQNEELGKLV